MSVRHLKSSTASVAVALALLAQPAFAQDETDEQPAAAPAGDAAAADNEGEILVVGSRIGGLTAFNSPDPVTVVDPEVAIKEGKFDTASMLQSSPAYRLTSFRVRC